MLIHWIWLSTRPSLNDRQKRLVLEAFSDPENAFLAGKEEYARVEGLTPEAVNALLDKDLTQAQTVLCQCVDKNIQICTYQDESYPYRLRHIPDPPLVLYYRGQLPDTRHVPVIAAVGTRKASAYGRLVAQRMGFQIARCGGLLVSGIADGNDAMAMQGALLAGGTVVGVLGNGVDVVYPKCNRRLFEDVLQRGCLISEFPPETQPYKWNFPRRNRIMSGMSDGVVVIEAPKISGALITARDAGNQGRDVFVVPGNIDMPTFEGSNHLLREGAIIARDGWDVVGEYAAMYPETVNPMGATAEPELPMENFARVAQERISPAKIATRRKAPAEKVVDKKERQPYSVIKEVLPKLPEEQRQIVELLTQERLVDEIISETGLPAGKVSAALTVLEIKGIIERHPGKRISLK